MVEFTRPSERADTTELEREREPETPECHPRSSGCVDKEFSEDFSESIEKPRRSTLISIITSAKLSTKKTLDKSRLQPRSKRTQPTIAD